MVLLSRVFERDWRIYTAVFALKVRSRLGKRVCAQKERPGRPCNATTRFQSRKIGGFDVHRGGTGCPKGWMVRGKRKKPVESTPAGHRPAATLPARHVTGCSAVSQQARHVPCAVASDATAGGMPQSAKVCHCAAAIGADLLRRGTSWTSVISMLTAPVATPRFGTSVPVAGKGWRHVAATGGVIRRRLHCITTYYNAASRWHLTRIPVIRRG